jgi:hypothetical protein
VHEIIIPPTVLRGCENYSLSLSEEITNAENLSRTGIMNNSGHNKTTTGL